MSDLRLVPVHPLSDDPGQHRLFDAWVGVHHAAAQVLWGPEHSGWTAEELRGRRRGDSHHFTDVAALDGDEVVGMLSIAEPQHDNRSTALVLLAVRPDQRRRGTGSALLQHAEATAFAHGRRVIQAETEWVAGQRDDSGEGFAAARGYHPAQTTIRSAMPLPANRRMLTLWVDGDGIEDAAAFRLETSLDGVPDSWLEDLAVLAQRMSTDAPLGDLIAEEECWDADRVRAELQWALESGRRIVVAVARDLTTNRLVGFTQLEVSNGSPEVAYQQDTLVLREARGHRLGLRLKAAAALELMDALPEVARVRTWNAHDNTPMLAVNADLGYRPEGYLREWQRELS